MYIEDYDKRNLDCPLTKGYCHTNCAWYDHEHNGCSVHSIMVELKRGNDE